MVFKSINVIFTLFVVYFSNFCQSFHLLSFPAYLQSRKHADRSEKWDEVLPVTGAVRCQNVLYESSYANFIQSDSINVKLNRLRMKFWQ